MVFHLCTRQRISELEMERETRYRYGKNLIQFRFLNLMAVVYTTVCQESLNTNLVSTICQDLF